MAGFGLRALKKVQAEDTSKQSRIYSKHIVYGDNFYAALVYLKLAKAHGGEAVQLVSPCLISKDSIDGEWKCSLSTLRSEAAANTLITMNPELEIFPIETKNVFYKDTKFHKFGGRAKPHELKEDEAFFTDAAYNIKLDNLFTAEQLENLDETLEKNTLVKYIDSIEKCQPTDLVEVTNYKLKTGEAETLECEKLYWCESPKIFYKKVENTDELSDQIGAYCTNLEHRIGLTVHFELKGKLYDGEGNVFLPQSVTYELGHFISEFKKFDPETNSQEFACMMFVDEDEVNEEDLAKKIKLMKRVIGRVFSDFDKIEYKERIQYDREILINKTDDSLVDKKVNVVFIGPGAPLQKEEHKDFKYLSRGIISLKSLEV